MLRMQDARSLLRISETKDAVYSMFGVMKKLPSDRKVLRCIYRMYEKEYPGPAGPDGRGSNDPYVPVDVRAVAEHRKCSPELVFGRLYYHLDAKHRYKQDSGAWVSLFQLNFKDQGHSVHFPFLASILAGFEEEHRKLFWSMVFSTAALVISVLSLSTNIVARWVH